PKYGFYYFQSLRFKEALTALSSATTISIVNKTKFESLPFPVAPLVTQRLIVEKIEELFSHIDAGVEGLKQAK
ncbi:restriction endonuclease subunit S, partial [Vibrio parahaemolyticus]